MNILKLKGKMVEKSMTAETLSEKLGVDRSTLYRKLNDGEKFTVGEAQKISIELDLTKEEVHDIFFG